MNPQIHFPRSNGGKGERAGCFHIDESPQGDLCNAHSLWLNGSIFLLPQGLTVLCAC